MPSLRVETKTTTEEPPCIVTTTGEEQRELPGYLPETSTYWTSSHSIALLSIQLCVRAGCVCVYRCMCLGVKARDNIGRPALSLSVLSLGHGISCWTSAVFLSMTVKALASQCVRWAPAVYMGAGDQNWCSYPWSHFSSPEATHTEGAVQHG